MKNILVTGGSGFVGSKLISHSNLSGSTFVGRSKPKGCKNYIKFDFENDNNYNVLFEIDYVIHLAGSSHIKEKTQRISINILMKIIKQHLSSRAAANAFVKRFIFISTMF